MQDTRSAGMIAPGMVGASLGLYDEDEILFSDYDAQEEAAFSAGASLDQMAVLSQTSYVGSSKKSSCPVHVPFPIVVREYANFICSCGDDTGWHLIATAIENAETHQTMAEVEAERFAELDSQCETSESPVRNMLNELADSPRLSWGA